MSNPWHFKGAPSVNLKLEEFSFKRHLSHRKVILGQPLQIYVLKVGSRRRVLKASPTVDISLRRKVFCWWI